MDLTGFLVCLAVLVAFPTLLVVGIELAKSSKRQREQRNPYMKPWADREPGRVRLRYFCLSCPAQSNDRLWMKDHAAVLGHHGWADRENPS